MRSEDIEVKPQWDVVQTMAELLELREHVKRFLEHTVVTMSTPRHSMNIFGDVLPNEVEHPMGHFLSIIESCQEGCYRRYGEDMFRQGKLFDVHVMKDDDDG